MPTGLGAVFFVLSLYCFVKGSGHLFSLLVFSGIFQAATVVTGASVQPYYLVALFFVARCFADVCLGKPLIRDTKGVLPLLCFGALAVISAFVFPRLFAGIPVYDPRLGLDDGFFIRPGLQFSGANKYQACLMIVNILVVLAAAIVPGKIQPACKSFFLSLALLFAILVLQFGFLHTGLSFPYGIFNNDQNYTLANADLDVGLARPNGTFSEPSIAGTATVAACLACLALYLRRGKGLWLGGLSLAGLLLVASTTSFIAFALGALFIVLAFPVFRFPFYLRLIRFKRVATLGGIAAFCLLFLAIPAIRITIAGQLLDKSSSQSFLARSAADLYAFSLAYQTHGIGVGLGSNRPSSLAASLISTMGVMGILLFVLLIARLFRNDLGQYFWLKWAAFGLVLDMAFGVPDIGFPLLWVLLALVARAAQSGGAQLPNETSVSKARLLRLRSAT